MGALSDIMLESGFSGCIQSVHGQPFLVGDGEDAGKTFTGTLLVAPNLDLDTEQGSDRREKSMLHFPKNDCPVFANSQGTLTDSDGQVWKVVGRTSNPADTTIDFEVVKVVSGKDT